MAIRREELIPGGYAYLKTRYVAGGAAVQAKRLRVRVVDFERGAATVEMPDGSRTLKPFHSLEPDDDWLAEHAQKEIEKKVRVREESQPPEPLTYTLADKLAAVAPPEPKAPEPAPESMPPEERQIAENLAEALGARPRFDLSQPAEKKRCAEYAIAELKRGRDLASLAVETGAPRNRLKYWIDLVDRGRPFTSSGRRPGSVLRALSDADEEELARAVSAKELTWSEAQQMYRVGRGTILRIMDSYHARQAQAAAAAPVEAPTPEVTSEPQPEPEPKSMPAPTHDMYTPAQRADFVRKYQALRAKGMRQDDAAAKLGVSRGSLAEWERRLQAGQSLDPRPRKQLSRDQQIEVALDIVVGHRTTREVEEKYGVHAKRAAGYAKALRDGLYGNVEQLKRQYNRRQAPAPRPTMQASPPPAPTQQEFFAPAEAPYAPPPQPPPPQPMYQPPPIEVPAYVPPPAPPPQPVYPALPPPAVNGHAAHIESDLRMQLVQAQAEVARLKAQVRSLLQALSHE